MPMPPQIVIIGSGFAGMYSALSAQRLIRSASRIHSPQVTVISPAATLALRPRLYELEAATRTAPLQKLFEVAGVRHVSGIVGAIDTKKQQVDVTNNGTKSTIQYDRLILAAGSQLVRPDIPGLADYAFDVDQASSATALEAHLASLAKQPSSPSRDTIVVCGAGFTGIELATWLPSRMEAIFGDTANVRVVLLDRNDHVGPLLGITARPAILNALDSLGIERRLGTSITSITAAGATTTSGDVIESKTIIWTGGMRANPLTEQIQGAKDELGRLIVDRHLSVKTIPTVFATGDTAHAEVDDQGNVALMSCQHASILGRVSGHNAAADLLGLPLYTYSQPEYGYCLSTGPDNAVLTQGWDRQVVATGGMARMMKDFVNTKMIYPPVAVAEEALVDARPDYQYPQPELPATLM